MIVNGKENLSVTYGKTNLKVLATFGNLDKKENVISLT